MTSPALDEDRLRRLAREIDAVVRRELPSWTARNPYDPGTTLLELLAFLGDRLSDYQARIADEVYLQRRRTPGGSRVTVTIDGSQWREVASLESSQRDDTVYLVEHGAAGSATIRFGDGQQGQRPPAGANVAAIYHVCVGAVQHRAAVTICWPPEPPLNLEVHASSAGISFARPSRSWRECLSRLFGRRP
jgi:hypothetical protein